MVNITVTNRGPQDIIVTNQYSSFGVNFYSGDIRTLKKTYLWFPANSFVDGGGNAVTYLLGPTFGTANGQPNSQTNDMTYWLDDNQGPTSPGTLSDQTSYPTGYVPQSNFLGFNKYFSSALSYYAGTVIKFSSPIYSLSFNLSRPGKNAGNSSNIDIYLFNTTGVGATKLVAKSPDIVVYTGGGDGGPEWVTYDSLLKASPRLTWQSFIAQMGTGSCWIT